MILIRKLRGDPRDALAYLHRASLSVPSSFCQAVYWFLRYQLLLWGIPLYVLILITARSTDALLETAKLEWKYTDCERLEE